jgi:hypothetical protein
MMDEPITQREQILDHLRRFGSITAMQAIDMYKILRLAARIADLRYEGFDIRAEWVTNKKGKRWVRYILKVTPAWVPAQQLPLSLPSELP